MMKTRMLLTAGAALLALAACSRNNADTIDNVTGVQTNTQTGIVTTKQGLTLNAASAAGGCVSAEDQRRPASDFTLEQRRQIVSCLNAAAVQQVNAQLPRQVDALTRLDRVAADGPLITYNATIMRRASELPPNAAGQLETNTRRMVCMQPQMRQTLEFGGSYAYRWVDSQGALIHELRIDAC
jgi:hypothetical protein